MSYLFVSDLHLGGGEIAPIFVGGPELVALLDTLSDPATHVIVNGDAVDFLLNEGPLRLDVDQAVAQAEAMASQPDARAALEALGRLLARGGSVTIRLGNHDVELALEPVQQVLRRALAQPEAIAERLVFERGETPGILEVGGVRVLYTHGEHADAWNRVDYAQLGGADFRYPPGSELVKGFINPLKARGLSFVDLLKPDIHGAVLTALAVDPAAVREIDGGLLAGLIGRVFLRKRQPIAFVGSDDEPEAPEGLRERLEEAGLDEAEATWLLSALGTRPLSFAEVDPEAPVGALGKLLRAGLMPYARFHRSVAGAEGERYFELAPTADEWAEARRLAGAHGVQVVIQGHTHAARLRAEEDLIYANTGTWIGLMRLPAPEASVEDWAAFLEGLRDNPRLIPARGGAVVTRRLTAVEVAEAEGGGAVVRLFEWVGGERRVMVEARVRG